MIQVEREKLCFNNILTKMLKKQQNALLIAYFKGLSGICQSRQESLSRLQQIYKTSLQQIQQSLLIRYQTMRQKLVLLHDLSEKTSTMTNHEQLHKTSQFSNIHDYIISWHHNPNNKNKNLADVVANLPKQNLLKYESDCQKIRQFIQSQTDKAKGMIRLNKPSFSSEWRHHSQSKFEYPQTSKPSPITNNLIQQLLKMPDNMIEKVMTELKKSELIKEQGGLKEKKKLSQTSNKELVKEVGQFFIENKCQVKFQYLPKLLSQKIGNAKNYYILTRYTINITVKNIETLVQRQFGFRKMAQSQRQCIITDLKNFRMWMNNDQSQLFVKAFELFNEFESHEISGYQIFVLYVLIANRVLDKLRKNQQKCIKNGTRPPAITQNQSPKNIRKQICYLYYHYDSLSKVKQLFKKKYFFDPTITPEYLNFEFNSLIIDTYQKIARQLFIENKQYESIMMDRKDFHCEPWITISTNYIQYQIHNQLSEKSQEYLKQMMEIIVSENQSSVSLENPTLKSRSKNETSENGQLDKNQIMFRFKLQNKQAKQNIIHKTKVIKVQQQSSDEPTSPVEID